MRKDCFAGRIPAEKRKELMERIEGGLSYKGAGELLLEWSVPARLKAPSETAIQRWYRQQQSARAAQEEAEKEGPVDPLLEEKARRALLRARYQSILNGLEPREIAAYERNDLLRRRIELEEQKHEYAMMGGDMKATMEAVQDLLQRARKCESEETEDKRAMQEQVDLLLDEIERMKWGDSWMSEDGKFLMVNEATLPPEGSEGPKWAEWRPGDEAAGAAAAASDKGQVIAASDKGQVTSDELKTTNPGECGNQEIRKEGIASDATATAGEQAKAEAGAAAAASDEGQVIAASDKGQVIAASDKGRVTSDELKTAGPAECGNQESRKEGTAAAGAGNAAEPQGAGDQTRVPNPWELPSPSGRERWKPGPVEGVKYRAIPMPPIPPPRPLDQRW